MKTVVLVIMSGAILTVLCISCTHRGDRIRLNTDQKAMKKEILKNVPIGSHVEDAKRLMEENGFSCESWVNHIFSVQLEDDPTTYVQHEKADFLSCNKSRTRVPPVTAEWYIAFVHKDGIISEVVVNFGLTGP